MAVLSFNQVQYLSECLDSILSQNYPNLQVVIADDGSTDGSAELLREYSSRHGSVVRIHLSGRNEGITANSNAALQLCDGEFIAWMGGDDLMLPNKLLTQVTYMIANPNCTLSYHDLEVFESESGQILRHFNHGPGSHRPQEGGARALIEHGTFAGACSIMTRHSAVPEGGFDARVLVASDWLFWIQTAAMGEIGFISKVLGCYRRHSGNITNRIPNLVDELVTLAIVEAEYPKFQLSVRRGRARILYIMAARHLAAREVAEGINHLRSALRHGLPSRTSLALWRSLLQERGRRRIELRTGQD